MTKTHSHTLLAPEIIKEVVRAIVEKADPERIILFGSYAAGTPDPGSDLDLLVIMETDQPRRHRLSTWDLFERSPCAMDILVRTPEEVERWLGTVNHIITEAFETGTVVYDAGRRPFAPMNEQHEELARQFLMKADNDLFAARRLIEVEDGPTDVVAFHTQQAAEKALKALLTLRRIKAPRTHNLVELFDLLADEVPALERFAADKEMSKYGVQVRYPEDLLAEPPREEVQRALEVAEATVEAVKEQMPPA